MDSKVSFPIYQNPNSVRAELSKLVGSGKVSKDEAERLYLDWLTSRREKIEKSRREKK